jgi:hypothetical protein
MRKESNGILSAIMKDSREVREKSEASTASRDRGLPVSHEGNTDRKEPLAPNPSSARLITMNAK